MSERAARVVLGTIVGLLVVAALATDLPAASDRRFWSDGATYYAMAASLARDFDLRYEAKDLERVRAEYPSGPQGVFLKQGRDGALYYAKAFVYPAAAAPFVRLLGPSRGLLLANALSFGLALILAYRELRLRAAPLKRASASAACRTSGSCSSSSPPRRRRPGRTPSRPRWRGACRAPRRERRGRPP